MRKALNAIRQRMLRMRVRPQRIMSALFVPQCRRRRRSRVRATRRESDAQTTRRRAPNNDELLLYKLRSLFVESGRDMRVRPSANISQAHKYSRVAFVFIALYPPYGCINGFGGCVWQTLLNCSRNRLLVLRHMYDRFRNVMLSYAPIVYTAEPVLSLMGR